MTEPNEELQLPESGVTPIDEPSDNRVQIETQTAQIVTRLEAVESSVQQLIDGFNQMTKYVEIIPRQMRQMGTRVDGVVDAIGDSRVRELLERIIGLYDLAKQLRDSSSPDVAQNYDIMYNQILQILRLHGVEPIENIERFDAKLHQAIEIVATESADEDGVIAQVYRYGFQSQHGILRYAEVVIKRYSPPIERE